MLTNLHTHTSFCDGKYIEVDGNSDTFQKAAEQFDGGFLMLADVYYKQFSEYIAARKPDIAGHLTLLQNIKKTARLLFLPMHTVPRHLILNSAKLQGSCGI